MVVQSRRTNAEPELKAGYASVMISHKGACFLEGDFGEEVFNEALERAKRKYGNPEALNPDNHTFTFEDGVVKGSNVFYVVLCNEVIADGGQRVEVATQKDLEDLLKAGDPLKFRGNYYGDTGLVSRSNGDSYKRNDDLAKAMHKVAKERLGDNLRLPVLFWLKDLKLEKAENPYGLSFILKEGANPVYVPILNQEGNFGSEDIDKKTGLPTKVGEKGDRMLYTRSEGLSRLYLDGDLGVGSDWNDLSVSGSDGRVVICGEAAQNEDAEAKLSETLKIIEAQAEKSRKGLELAERALKVLDGKE